MIIHFAKPVLRQIRKLPRKIIKKTHKQFKLLRQNIHHPSLHFKKMSGKDQYEGRVNYHYRFTGKLIRDEFYVTAIGPHKEVLGK